MRGKYIAVQKVADILMKFWRKYSNIAKGANFSNSNIAKGTIYQFSINVVIQEKYIAVQKFRTFWWSFDGNIL